MNALGIPVICGVLVPTPTEDTRAHAQKPVQLVRSEAMVRQKLYKMLMNVNRYQYVEEHAHKN